MRELAERFDPAQKEYGDGLRVRLETGFAHILPRWGGKGIRISGEAANIEAAEEICTGIEKSLAGKIKK